MICVISEVDQQSTRPRAPRSNDQQDASVLPSTRADDDRRRLPASPSEGILADRNRFELVEANDLSAAQH